MGTVEKSKQAHKKRKRRVRKKIFGTQDRPRLSVFKSARHIYAQVIIDTTGQTVVSASTVEKEEYSSQSFAGKVDAATFTGKLIAQRALEKGVTKVVFDRNGFLYHGRVQAVASGAREAGLDF